MPCCSFWDGGIVYNNTADELYGLFSLYSNTTNAYINLMIMQYNSTTVLGNLGTFYSYQYNFRQFIYTEKLKAYSLEHENGEYFDYCFGAWTSIGVWKSFFAQIYIPSSSRTSSTGYTSTDSYEYEITPDSTNTYVECLQNALNPDHNTRLYLISELTGTNY